MATSKVKESIDRVGSLISQVKRAIESSGRPYIYFTPKVGEKVFFNRTSSLKTIKEYAKLGVDMHQKYTIESVGKDTITLKEVEGISFDFNRFTAAELPLLPGDTVFLVNPKDFVISYFVYQGPVVGSNLLGKGEESRSKYYIFSSPKAAFELNIGSVFKDIPNWFPTKASALESIKISKDTLKDLP